MFGFECGGQAVAPVRAEYGPRGLGRGIDDPLAWKDRRVLDDQGAALGQTETFDVSHGSDLLAHRHRRQRGEPFGGIGFTERELCGADEQPGDRDESGGDQDQKKDRLLGGCGWQATRALEAGVGFAVDAQDECEAFSGGASDTNADMLTVDEEVLPVRRNVKPLPTHKPSRMPGLRLTGVFLILERNELHTALHDVDRGLSLWLGPMDDRENNFGNEQDRGEGEPGDDLAAVEKREHCGEGEDDDEESK